METNKALFTYAKDLTNDFLLGEFFGVISLKKIKKICEILLEFLVSTIFN